MGSLVLIWTIDGEPEHYPDGQGTGGHDGDSWKWWLRRGDERTSRTMFRRVWSKLRTGSEPEVTQREAMRV